MDMGVDGKRWLLEGLSQYHLRRFVPNTGERLQRFQRIRDAPFVLAKKYSGEGMDGLCLLRSQSTRPNYLQDFFYGQSDPARRRVGTRPQTGRHLIDSLICALCRKQNGDEQRVGVAVIERNGGFWIEPLQLLGHIGCPLLQSHGFDGTANTCVGNPFSLWR